MSGVNVKVRCKYIMMSSDQILWNFSRLCSLIYSVELIFLKLKVQHICCFYTYFLNSPVHGCKDFPDKTALTPPTEHILA